jgi:hypothetical protein
LRQEQFGKTFGDGVAVEAVSRIEVLQIAGLAEPFDPERRDALA